MSAVLNTLLSDWKVTYVTNTTAVNRQLQPHCNISSHSFLVIFIVIVTYYFIIYKILKSL